MGLTGLHNSYPRRLIPTDLRVWLERVNLLDPLIFFAFLLKGKLSALKFDL